MSQQPRNSWFLYALMILSIISSLYLASCANRAKEALEINWEYRQSYVYDNDALTDDQKRNTIYNWGAALEVEPETIEAELTEKLGEESEEEDGE